MSEVFKKGGKEILHLQGRDLYLCIIIMNSVGSCGTLLSKSYRCEKTMGNLNPFLG